MENDNMSKKGVSPTEMTDSGAKRNKENVGPTHLVR